MELYNQLKSVVESNPKINTPVSYEEWISYSEKAQLLDIESAELLYALILYYNSLLTGVSVPLPFNCRQITKTSGVIFNLDNVPPPLQHLIIAFIDRVPV